MFAPLTDAFQVVVRCFEQQGSDRKMAPKIIEKKNEQNLVLYSVFQGSKGPVAQWITRLPTEQKIAGSIPAWIDFFNHNISVSIMIISWNKSILTLECSINKLNYDKGFKLCSRSCSLDICGREDCFM